MNDLLLTFYGDDFTGSTDALESLACYGVPAVLFFDPPTDAEIARFPGVRAIGVAGESRSRSPEWMSQQLPGIFARLRELGAGVCHYKVCSTFDSSPHTGSIGRAIEIGREVFGTACAPVVVAAPHLGRYVLFGNLFAAYAAGGGVVHRIDRHPTMSCHPVTPMDEADLRLHLQRQTTLKIGLIDVRALQAGHAEVPAGAEITIFDGLDESTLLETGRLLWNTRPPQGWFAAGSSGLTQALVRYWRASGMIGDAGGMPKPKPVDRIVVVSGSCSPVTAGQIRWAKANGFATFRFDAAEGAQAALDRGHSVVLYTALGSDDRMPSPGGEALGRSLGRELRKLLDQSGVRRAIVAGGDSSSHAMRELGINALTVAAQLSPGAPLCRAHVPGNQLDGLELVLKGGQMGPENFFELVRNIHP